MNRFRWLSGFAIVCSVAVVAPEAHAAAHPLRSEALVAQTVQVDGARAVWQRPNGSIVVSDDSRHTSSVVRDTGCSPIGLRDATVLLRCDDGSAMLLSTADGQRRTVPGRLAGQFFSVIGRYWLYGEDCAGGGGSCSAVYLNWRTGEERAAHGSRDLDSPTLTLRPARRPPYVRTARSRTGEAAERADISFVGRNGTVLLSRCTQGCASVSYAAGLVTWIEADVVRAYEIARHRFSTYFARGFRPRIVVHTSHRVYAQTASPTNAQPGQLRVASWGA